MKNIKSCKQLGGTVNTLIQLLWDKDEAMECKLLNFSYELYCSYLQQFRRDTTGNSFRVIPVSQAAYEQL